MPLTPEQRRSRAAIGGYARAAKYDMREGTQPARDAFLAKFEDEVDPDRVLPPAERERRAIAARKAHMRKLALRSAKARARKPVR